VAEHASPGQVALLPVQDSAASHFPADGRQIVVAGWNTSVGQAPLVPVQLSGTSQQPAD